MILETYKLSISQLKVTCSTSVYKNLSLIMRICNHLNKEENRIYNLVSSTGLFDGQMILKGKLIDTVAFQLDTQRKKYLPKQIELQLNLTYRTGKLNQKLYSINFNEFIMKKKGTFQKQIKITQRLYSLNAFIIARSTALDSSIQPSPISTMTKIKSQKHFDRHGSLIPDKYMRRRYSKFHSPQQQTIIKYTINENIKITRPQQIQSTPILQTDMLNQQRETSILREKFDIKESELSEMKQQETKDQSSFVHRNRMFTTRGRQPITQRLVEYPSKGITTAVSYAGQKQKLSILQQKVSQLQQKHEQQQKRNYKLQKQLSSLKNKIQHLYHEKSILLKEKQEERLIFETKDKQEKMRQRRDIEQLRRVYESQLREKDERITTMERDIRQKIQDVKYNEQKRYKQTIDELNIKLESKQQQILQLSQQIRVINDLLHNKVHKVIESLQDKQQQVTNNMVNRQENKRMREFLIDQQQYYEDGYEQQQQQEIQSEKKTQRGYNKDNQQQQQHQFMKQSQLIRLMQQQSCTYNEMISKLQNNLYNLQQQIITLQQQQLIAQNKHQQLLSQVRSQYEQKLIQYQHIIQQLNTTIKSSKHIERDDINTNHSINTINDQLLSQQHYNSKTQYIININSQQPYQYLNQPPQTSQSIRGTQQTIKITETTRYKITIYPQTQIIYIPSSYFTSQTLSEDKLKQSSSSQGFYGKNYQLYEKYRQLSNSSQSNSSQSSVKNTGYFGKPIHINNYDCQEHHSNNYNENHSNANSETQSNANSENHNNNYKENHNNNYNDNDQNYRNNEQQSQTSKLLIQGQTQQCVKQQLHYNFKKDKHHISQSINHQQQQQTLNLNISNSNSNDIIRNDGDSKIIINKQQDSYINSNGQYVKTSLIEVYSKNTHSIMQS